MVLNFDLMTVGLSVASILVLGVAIFFNDRKSQTNKSFLYFAIASSVWGVINYFAYKITSVEVSLWLFRLVMFFAVWQIFFLFRLFYYIPERNKKNGPLYKYVTIPLTAVTSILTLTPLLFSSIEKTPLSEVPKTKVENGIIIFAIVSLSLFLSAIYQLIKKIAGSKGKERLIYLYLLSGSIITFSLIIIFNFILPAFFSLIGYIPLGAIFMLPIIFLSSYAVYKGNFVNVRIISISVLVFLLSIITFTEVLFTDVLWLLIVRMIIFLFVLLFGLFLIRSVMREVHQREYIEKLAGELAQTNDQLKTANDKLKELDKQKTEFVSIASHQLRSPLTAIKGYSSMLLEGSFGPIEDRAKEAVEVVFQSSLKLINIIEDFLNITRIELGRMKYEISIFDLGKIVETVINDQIPNIKKKGLTSKLEKGESNDTYLISADNGKITQVISNLIDNSIKYTPQGEIKAKIENLLISGKSVIRFSISDTGVGIDQETLPRLFDKFVRADDAGKTNITGTGLGLYVAKQIVESLGGKIWAESEGKGKGSTFIVEFPKAEGEITQTDHKVEFYTKADFNKLKGK